MRKILALAGTIAVISVVFSSVYADDTITGKQVTLSGDLANDPLAQDILKKIEQSKKQIAELQKKQEDKEKQDRYLELKRAQALDILQKDLAEWEALWEEYTFDYMFSQQSGVFWDQYNFTNSKIIDGKAALRQALSDGGNAEDARAAYAEAAKVRREDLIAANAIFNVNRGYAIYGQQILFDSQGQFHDIISGDQLRKYYTDYRLDPTYLAANKNDTVSWTAMSRDIHAVCQEGYVLVYRIDTTDHICTTKETSKIWKMYGMGNVLFDESVEDTDTLTIAKLKQDQLKEKIRNINNKIDSAYDAYDAKVGDVREKYDLLAQNYTAQQQKEVQDAVSGSSGMSKENMDKMVRDIREKYGILEASLSRQEEQTLKILRSSHESDMVVFVQKFEPLSDVRIVVSQDDLRYHAVRE